MVEKYQLFKNNRELRVILDAIPLPVFLVDEVVSILDLNAAGAQMVEAKAEQVYLRRGGEILHCIHSTSPGGCGRAEICKDCMIRNCVADAFAGKQIIRRSAAVTIVSPEGAKDINLFISASPFDFGGEKFVLLVFEDISELLKLRNLLPICAKCKKIRDDQDYWQSLESYMAKYMQINFTHGLCPTCLEIAMREVDG